MDINVSPVAGFNRGTARLRGAKNFEAIQMCSNGRSWKPILPFQRK